MRFVPASFALVALLALTLQSHAQEPVRVSRARSTPDPSVPLPGWVRSIEVLNDGARVFRGPGEASGQWGSVARGTRLPVMRRVAGRDCPSGVWYQSRADLFICSRHVELSREPPAGVPQPWVAEGERLPKRYAFVRFDAARAYERPSDYLLDNYAAALGRGFGVVVVGEETFEGQRFALTESGFYILRSELGFARGSDLQGVQLRDGEGLDFVWVRQDQARLHERPAGRVLRRLGRRTRLRVATDVETRAGWIALADGGFLRERDVQGPQRVPRPAGVADDERWIDVSVDQQVLVAYEGDRPVFTTLVSTGRDSPHHRTPLGEHRIWIKLAFSDMSNLRLDAPREYAIEDVPWVQYFEGSNGLHAAFWHDDFGHARSHGCVNLSPLDARWLFEFTTPPLPPGWTAIFPRGGWRGTMVRVRE